ncbi:MAG: MFS transporter [Hyphomicrobiaceae bacterium]|nr:MFS transporter [Hyphomicrobiaceae bacterium]
MSKVLISNSALPPGACWFLAGTFASNIGNGIHTLTAGALLYQHTGSIAAFGIVIIIEQVVTFLMQAVAGPFVDTRDPRRTALIAEVARGLIVCALALLLAARPDAAFGIIMAMTGLIRVIHTFHRAGTFSLTPGLVTDVDLIRLNSWFSACQQGGQLLGLAATGVVVAHYGAAAAFFVNGLSFLVSALTLAAFATPPSLRNRQSDLNGPLWRNFIDAWADISLKICRDVRLFGAIIVSTADNVMLIMFNLILAPLVAERLAANPYWLSLIASGFAFGAFIASAAVVPVANKFGTRNTTILGLTGQAICFTGLWGFAASHAMLALAIALGVFNTISWTTAITTVQRAAPPEIRGRLAVARSALTAAIIAPLVMLISIVARDFSNATTLLVAALICLAFLSVSMFAGRETILNPKAE